jgi:hypothetical protein
MTSKASLKRTPGGDDSQTNASLDPAEILCIPCLKVHTSPTDTREY